MLGSPPPGTLPFPLGSLLNPLLLRVTSLGRGTRCFIFNSPPLPLGELHERGEGRPLGRSPLLCPCADPVSLMLRLAALWGVSLLPACPPFPSWPVFCVGALVPISSSWVFPLLSALSTFSFHSFLLSSPSFFSPLPLFLSPPFSPGLPSPLSLILGSLPSLPLPLLRGGLSGWTSCMWHGSRSLRGLCRLRWELGVGGDGCWNPGVEEALGQKLFSSLSRCSLWG